MSLESINYAAQAVGSVAVVASLIILIWQARLGLRLMRDTAMHLHAAKLQSISRSIFECPGLADVWSRGINGMAGLNEEERIRFTAFVFYTFRVWEEIFLQHRSGATDEDLWTANAGFMRDAHALPGVREVWAIRRHNFTPRFQAYYETYTAAGEAKPLFHLLSRGQST